MERSATVTRRMPAASMVAAVLCALTLLASAPSASASSLKTRVWDFFEDRTSCTDGEGDLSPQSSSGKTTSNASDCGGRNLFYNRFRYYDPAVGRYVSPDPVGLLGGMNVFAYAANTTGRIDPLGLVNRCPKLRDKKGKFRKPRTALEEIQALGPLMNKKRSAIQRRLRRRGYTSVPAHSGGTVWTRAMPDGSTAVVRIDPAMVRTPPRGWADEVPHGHKEIVATTNVVGGNYQPGHAATYSDAGTPATTPADKHIPIVW